MYQKVIKSLEVCYSEYYDHSIDWRLHFEPRAFQETEKEECGI